MTDNQYSQIEHLAELRKMETGQDEPEPHQMRVRTDAEHAALRHVEETEGRNRRRNFMIAEARRRLLVEVEAWWVANHYDKEFTCDHDVGICYCSERDMIARIRHALNPSWTCSEPGCTGTAWHHMSDGDWCDSHLFVGSRKGGEGE